MGKIKYNCHCNLINGVGLSVILVISFILSVCQSLFLVEGFSELKSTSLVKHDQVHSKYPIEPVITILSRHIEPSKTSGHSSTANLLVEDDNGEIYKILYNEDTRVISLSCWASNPIIWNFDGPLGMMIESTNISRYSSGVDLTNSSNNYCSTNYCYNTVINVTILRNKFTGTGNYTCSVLKNNQTSSIYLYGNEKSPVAFLRPSSVINVSLNKETRQYKNGRKILILPCRANNPHVKPFLYFLNEGKFHAIESYPDWNQQYKIEYNAKTGFEIISLSDKVNFNLTGEFKCEISRNESNHKVSIDFIRINVIHDQLEKLREKSEDLLIEFKGYGNCASFVCSHKQKQENSSNFEHEENLEISIVKCQNPMHCDLASTSVYDKMDFSESNKDDCSQMNDILDGVSIEAKLHERPSGIVVCRTINKKLYQTLEYFQPLQPPVNDQVIIADGKTNVAYPMDPRILFVDVHNRTFYVNEIIEISCNASSFLFANGLQWLIQFRNQSIQQPTMHSNSMTSGRGYTATNSKINMTSGDIDNIICLAPIWNSSQWNNVTLKIRVIDGTLPSITGISQSEILFGIDDVNKSLICEATGIPRPDILWYKGTQPYVDETQNSFVHYDTLTKEHENVTISHLNFNKVAWNSSTVSGRYYCNATNSKGSAIQFISIQVEGNSTWKIWTLFFCISVLCIVGLLAFYLHKYWKKSVGQEEYIRQLTAKEIDEFKLGRRPTQHSNKEDGKEFAMYFAYDEDKYEINEEDLILDENEADRKLGEGNYGVVFKGNLLQNGSQIPVAVKTLQTWNTMEAKALMSELKILMYVGKHQNVVSLIGAITNLENCKIQVIIEYCALRSLESYLTQKRGVFLNEIEEDKINFSPQSITAGSTSDYVRIDYAIKTIDLIRWSYQFACGMQHLSSRKIIHGDLAIRNLLLTETRDLKISDFGLSKKLTNYSTNYVRDIPSDKAISEQRRQPWRSLALEYWSDSKKFSTQSDVWGFGVALWEIFSLGDIPHEEWNYGPEFVNALASGYRMKKPDYATSHIHSIMLLCWEEKPEKRPSFETLSNWFKEMLPGNYMSSIEMSSIEMPSMELTPANWDKMDYIYGEELEQLQLQFQDC